MFELLRTSTFRLAVFYFGLFATSVAALLVMIYWQTVVYAENQTGESIDSEVASLAEEYRERGLPALVDAISERSDPERGSTMLYLLTDADRRPLAGNLTRWPDVRVDPDGWMRFSLAAPSDAGSGGERHVAQAAYFVLAHGFQLLVGRDLSDLAAYRERIILALGWSAAITLCLGFGGGLVMSRSVLRRIEIINRASAAIIGGDTARRIPVTGRADEFDRLASNLNAMLDRIQRLMDGMRQVTDNIAHDLRSPLGRLRSRIEMALLSPPSSKRDREHLAKTLDEADQLLATFSALLEIAEAEAGSKPR